MSNTNNIAPMLIHALESFEHGIFHHLDNTDTSRKFAFLHIDHAIELILKEKVVRLGLSILGKTENQSAYTKPIQYSMTKTFQSLKNPD